MVNGVLASPNPHVMGIRSKCFRWTKDFSLDEEAKIAPVWIKLPGLPLYYFDHANLEALGNSIGSHVAMNRICVEMDVTNLQKRIHLDSLEHEPLFKRLNIHSFYAAIIVA